MKRVLMAALMICFLVPVLPVQAKTSELYGVYIAPKFVYSFTGTDLNDNNNKGEANEVHGESLDDGLYGGALAVGYDFNPKFTVPVRVELEYSIFSQFKDSKIINTSPTTSKLDIQTLFINTYYDFHNTSKFTPYIGAGLGFAFVGTKLQGTGATADFTMGKKTETNFAWNVGLGCSYSFTENIALDLAYRYAQFGKGKSGLQDGAYWVETGTIDAHQVTMGVRFTF